MVGLVREFARADNVFQRPVLAPGAPPAAERGR